MAVRLPAAALRCARHAATRAPALLLAIFLPACLAACSNSWESDAIAARVVDASTGAPVADAIVVVNWELRGGYEGYPSGQLAIFERLTDAQGAFDTPAWGPKKTSSSLILDGDQPLVHVFKPGYEPLTVHNFVNAPGQDFARAQRRISPQVNGQTLRLRPFTASLHEYSGHLNDFWNPLTSMVSVTCDWRAAPRLFAALSQMKEEFLRADVTSDLQLERNLCGKGASRP